MAKIQAKVSMNALVESVAQKHTTDPSAPEDGDAKRESNNARFHLHTA
jgi:hypothetical protein